MSRRGLLAAALTALGGCGFRPLYGERPASAPAADGPVAQDLAAVRVALIPERSGQLLRRELQRRLAAPAETSPAARYELRVGLGFAAEPLGFRRDGTPSRVRTVATANWWLVTLAASPQTVANGVERAFDSYNIPDNQFFAADVSRDATDRRLVEQLAGDITRHLAVALANRGAAPA
jgi:LPS-assembly lipoprotein